VRTSSTNKTIREIISMVKEGKLIPRPEFQRRLVWTREDKNMFLDSVLRGYPFPEIYLADGDVDLETGTGTQLLVDGLQRVSTITQYFDDDPELKLTTVPRYKDLLEEEKRAFLQYDVSVRDLGAVDRDLTIEVFRRINATKYSLLDIEINNAVYAGALKKFAEQMVESDFFKIHDVFSAADLKRMGDLRFGVLIIGTMIQGYFNRDDAFEGLLDRYNDDFPLAAQIKERCDNVFSFVNECNFDPKSRLWRKADLFTAIVEFDRAVNMQRYSLLPSETVARVDRFFAEVDGAGITTSQVSGVYHRAALQASNDRVNRVRRGVIFEGIIYGRNHAKIMTDLEGAGLKPSDPMSDNPPA
jgi:hypothetical protein